MTDDPQNTNPQDPPPEEGEPAPRPSDAAREPADGPASQDEIDALINGADAAAGETPTPQTPAGDESFSQAEIDAAVNAAASAEEKTPSESTAPTGDAAPPAPQQDVPPPDAPSEPSAEKESESTALGADELFSQADIDAALGAESSSDATTPPTAPPPAAEPAPHASAQDEIDAMLASAGADISAPDPAAPQPTPPADVQLDSAGRPFDEAAAAMAAAIAESAAEEETPPSSPAPNAPTPEPLELEDFSADGGEAEARDISILRDVNLRVQIELGRTQMYIDDVLKLSEGSVVELDNLAGDPVDVIVNGRLIARGEVLVLSDNFCVRVSEVIAGPQNVAVA